MIWIDNETDRMMTIVIVVVIIFGDKIGGERNVIIIIVRKMNIITPSICHHYNRHSCDIEDETHSSQNSFCGYCCNDDDEKTTPSFI